MDKEIRSRGHFLISFILWMSVPLTAVVFYMPLPCSAQGIVNEGHIIKTYYDEGHSLLKEMYYVKDLRTRELDGPYESFYLNGKPKVMGNYIHNSPNGTWTYYYENGNQKMRGTMKENESVGLWKYYYENGELNMQGELANSKRNGLWKFYYESGLLKSEGPFTDGEKSGIWNYYYEDGTLKAQAYFYGRLSTYKEFYTTGNVKMKGYQLNGRSDSLWTYYFDNGTVQATGSYLNGLRNGHWIYYNEKGIKTSEGDYLNGEKNGPWAYFYDNGKISSQGVEKNGEKEGHWKLYDVQGHFKGDGNFVNGSGTYKEYYSNGHLKVTGNIVDDRNEGKWLYYYEDGSLEGECNFVDGEGVYTGYYPSGKIKMKGTIKNGKNVGNWELYAENGTLTGYYHPIYENDKPVFKVLDQKPKEDSVARDYIKPEYFYRKKKIRYFTPVINEYRGFILATNPFATILGRLPLSIEYYCQERLGHEFLVSILRSPFFGSHSSIDPNVLYQQGFDFAFRQKLYSRDNGFGMFYIANELRYTSIDHSFNALDSAELPAVITTRVRAIEQRYEYSLIVGNRWMQLFSERMIREKRQNGVTLDVYIGMGIGLRKFDKKYSNNSGYDAIFKDLNQRKLSLSPRLGINLGYVF